MGVWAWGLGLWAQPPIPNPQSPIPNPQSPFFNLILFKYINYENKNYIVKK
jgi:hypothetical protein